MQDLNVSLIQADVKWEDSAASLLHYDELLKQLPPSQDLVLLPETFNTGFSMNAQNIAQSVDGDAVNWMKAKANEHNCVFAGSIITEENAQYFNRLHWVKPNGDTSTYDKKHLFVLSGEDKVYTAGKGRLINKINAWRICTQICYDLRFPAWNRNKNDYDVLVFVASWPDVRSYAWRQLLIARAIENQAYVIGVSRVGTDGNGIYHSGHSMIIRFDGEVLHEFVDEEVVAGASLSLDNLQKFREKFPFHEDADSYTFD